MSRESRIVLSVASLCLVTLAAAALALSRNGVYGWTLFVMLPLLAGGLGTWATHPVSAWRAMRTGAVIGFLGCFSFLVVGLEGFICVLMAIPVIVPLAVIGALLVYWMAAGTRGRMQAGLCVVLPFTLFFDLQEKPRVYQVTTDIVVNASAEAVWQNVVSFPDIPGAPDWLLGAGFAYPIRSRIEGTGIGSSRSCDLSTGNLAERVVIWDEPRLLRFVVESTPPSMKEMGLYGQIHPKHLTGYYVAKQGQFELIPLSGGRTKIIGTSWYQHGLWPAGYWRLWSDAIVHHVHRRVLDHIRALSEGGQPRQMIAVSR